MKRKFLCTVTETTEVEIQIEDEDLNEEFMTEFRKSFYDFSTIREHAKHLAQLKVRDIINDDSFVEGYGTINERTTKGDMDISANIMSSDVEVELEEL